MSGKPTDGPERDLVLVARGTTEVASVAVGGNDAAAVITRCRRRRRPAVAGRVGGHGRRE